MKKEITVLDTKRSNAINIGLTVLPTARTIKAAILKMDSSVINKEGIEVNIESFRTFVLLEMLMYMLYSIILTDRRIVDRFDV